jgi:AcrR family transcriptional regulator
MAASAPATDEKRERILRAAERLFDLQGYAGTTIDQIASELGVTKPFIYYYFHNKLDIFETLSWKPTVDARTALDFAPDDARPAHVKLARGLEQIVRFTLLNHPAASFPYREPQVYRPEYRQAERRLVTHFYGNMQALMEQGRTSGHLHFNETRLTALAAVAVPAFIHSWYRPDGRLSVEELVRELAPLTWRVIGLRDLSDLA